MGVHIYYGGGTGLRNPGPISCYFNNFITSGLYKFMFLWALKLEFHGVIEDVQFL